MKFLSFGEILWDVYEHSAVIGGAPFNFAGHLAQHGEQISLLSAVGDDELGRGAISEAEKIGVNVDYIGVSEQQTGKCLVTLDGGGVPKYNLLDNVAYDYIGGEVENEFDVLYFGTLALRHKQNREYLSRLIENNSFREIFCDVNIRPPYFSEQSVKFCFDNATIIKISDEELPVINGLLFGRELDYKAAAQEIAKKYKNVKIIIITRGGEGAYLLDTVKGFELEEASIRCEVVSTVGAGDSFSAAFMSKLMGGKTVEECLKHAVKVSGFVVTQLEAIPKYPDNF